MKISSIEEAKEYAVDATTRYLSHDEALRRIEEYRSYIKLNNNKELWQKEIASLENWLASDEYRNGNYPQGIDALILDLVEWRSAIYAFQNVDAVSSPFSKYAFHGQWLTGGAYAVFCILGKLVSTDSRDNSLRKLWSSIFAFMESDNGCSKEEISFINDKFDKAIGHFKNENSKAVLFRNTAIAHNERTPRIEWSDIDKDIEILIRIWSLIVSWSSFGMLFPFRASGTAFAGLDNVFSQSEILQLRIKRDEYLERVRLWSVTHLHSGVRDPDCGAISTLSVSVGVVTSAES